MPMLCVCCEKKLNRWETPFLTNVYHPWAGRTGPVDLAYGPWMLKFAVSVSWRALHRLRDSLPEAASAIDKSTATVLNVEETWRKFLLDEVTTTGSYEQHMILFDHVEDAAHLDELPANISRYLTRGAEINIGCRGDHLNFIFTKMGPVTLVGFVDMPNGDKWTGTKLHAERGTVGGGRTIQLSQEFWEFICERARVAAAEYSRLSPKQQEVIASSFLANPERAAASDSLRTMQADLEMFGPKRVFRQTEDSEQTH